MAIRKKGNRFQVYYRNPNTRRQESVTVKDRAEAVKMDALIKYRIQFEPDTFKKEERTVKEKKGDTFEDAVWLFLKAKRYSRESLKSQLMQLKPWLEAFSGLALDEIDKAAIGQVKMTMLGDGRKPSTVRRKMAALRSVLRWAEDEGIISSAPKMPPFPAEENERFVPPSQAELLAMLRAAPDHIQRVIILGFTFGMRIGGSELFRLSWEDVDLARRVLRVPSSRKNKHEPWRELPIRDALVPVFRRWYELDRQRGVMPVTVVHWNGEPVSSIKTSWAATCRRAGVRYVRPYDLRHAFATEALAAGVDVGTTARMMGHTSPVMLLTHYQHVLDAQKKEAMDRLPKIECMTVGCMTYEQ